MDVYLNKEYQSQMKSEHFSFIFEKIYLVILLIIASNFKMTEFQKIFGLNGLTLTTLGYIKIFDFLNYFIAILYPPEYSIFS